MNNINNSVLIQGASLSDIESMIDRAVERRLDDICDRLTMKRGVLVKRKEAARMIGVSLPTIDSYARAGFLHARHIGGRVFFDEEEVQRYISNNHCINNYGTKI